MKARLVAACAVTALAAGLAAAAFAVVHVARNPVGAVPPGGFEALRATARHETSSACVSCHPDHHASWARTHHAMMTRDPSPRAVAGRFDGTPVTFLGVTTVPLRIGDDFYFDTLSPVTGNRERLRVARVTGSRRMQQYHVRAGDRFIRLPVAWSIEEQRWFHLDEAFFEPPGSDFNALATAWDLNCIFCHSVGPEPGLTTDGAIASRVEELGIACEACHAPAEEHAKRMRSPLRRYAFHFGHEEDPTLVNPGRLPQVRSVQVCGHCHGQRVPSDVTRIAEIYREGDPFVPGEDLSLTWSPIYRDTTTEGLNFAPRFWKDGSPRLTAYEYQGLLRSPCYEHGDMTCVSCHSMHWSDPAGQLRRDLDENELCTQCHPAQGGANLPRHAGHGPQSPGSRCVACHMPPVVYGVMSWHPTHEVSSPDPGASATFSKPDACTACHVGRSLAWADAEADRLWPNRKRHGMPADPSFMSAEIPRALFAGDAVYRTFAAWRLGVPSPPEEDAARLAVPLLGEALLDPYANVRRQAARSLDALTRRNDVPRALEAEDRRRAMRDALQKPLQPVTPPGWPFLADGSLDRGLLSSWMSSREELRFHVGE